MASFLKQCGGAQRENYKNFVTVQNNGPNYAKLFAKRIWKLLEVGKHLVGALLLQTRFHNTSLFDCTAILLERYAVFS